MTDRDERTGVELLREAARLMREDYGPDADVDGCPEGDPFMLAVIGWLEAEAASAEADAADSIYGSGAADFILGDGSEPGAVAVARAYLAAPVSAGEPRGDEHGS